MHEFVAGILGALLLHIFFRGLQHRWPEHYFSMEDVVDPVVSRGPLRYLAFRALPVYFTAVLLQGTLAQLGGRPVLGTVYLTALHLIDTNGRALFVALRGRILRGGSLPAASIYFQFVTAVVAATASTVAYFTFDLWLPLIPDPHELSAAVWTGLFAAVLAAYVQRLSSKRASLRSLVAST